MIRKILGTFILLLLLAAPASARWDIEPGDGEGKCVFPNQRICYFDRTTSGNTPVLPTLACENFSVWFISDITTQDHDSTLQIRWSIDQSVASPNTSEVWGNKTLDGNPVSDTDSINGADAPAIYGVMTVSDNTARVAVQCFPRK